MRTALKFLIRLLHNIVSRSEITLKIYFRTLNLLLKNLPDNKLKWIVGCSLLYNHSKIPWSHIEFAPQKVRIAGSSLTIKLIPYLAERDLGTLVFKTLTYEKGVFAYLEQHIRDYDAVIEIGANTGLFTICLAQWFSRLGKPTNNIFSFEPSREAYWRLLKNLKLNKIEGVQAFNLAVGGRDEFADFYEPPDNLANGSLYHNFAELFSASPTVNKTFVVNGNLLERLVPDSPRILLKINAEGAECPVLESMKDFIAKRAPVIIMEVLPLYQNQLNQLDFLFSAQYSFFNFTNRGLESRDRFIASDFYTYLLLPRIQK
jgi:FkbM family methyltransferase